MRLFFILVMALGGLLVAFQVPINVRLREAVGSPILSAAVSFLVGTTVLLLIVASGAFGGTGYGLRGFREAPLWAYLGGIAGACYVFFSILALPRVGAAVTIACAILGQQIGSLLIDSFGWFGVPRVPFTMTRLIAVVLLLLGVVLLQRK